MLSTTKRSILVGIVALTMLCGGVINVASAHETGESFVATSTSYVVDIGYDPAVFVEGEYTRFDFKLEKAGTTEGSAPFAQVWVRILRGKDTMLATGIWNQPIGPTTLLYEFLEPGEYTLDVSYRDADGNDIATATFPLPVTSTEKSSTQYLLYGLASLIGLILGISVSRLVRVAG